MSPNTAPSNTAPSNTVPSNTVPPDTISSTVAAVIAAERAWVEAHRTLDIDKLASLMADDYACIGDDGRVVNKAAELASYQRPNRHWDFAESDEYDLSIEGDTAILIGRWRGRGVNGPVHFDYAARFVAIYVKRSPGWQLRFGQSTPIPGMNAAGEWVSCAK